MTDEVPQVESCAPPPIEAIHPARVALPRWIAPLFFGFVITLVPWIVWLAISLPRRHTDRYYDLTWVGFDCALLIALAAVMRLSQQRSTYVEIAATVAGTLLVVDAWFDITTSSPGIDRWEAIAAAVVFELPIAGLCAWLARNAESVRRRRATSLMWWLEHARDASAPTDVHSPS